MATLLAEDLLLLLLDDEKGTTPGLWVDVRVPLGAAVLAELAFNGDIEVEPQTSVWRTPKVRATGAAADEPVLAEALGVVAEKPRGAVDLAGRIGDGLRDRLAERLAEQGLLERHDDRVLGLFPRTRWPAAATDHEARVRRRLHAIVVQGADPDPRTAALAGILQALGRLAPVLGLKGQEARTAKQRVTALGEGDWASKAVRDAVDQAAAAVTITTTTGAVISGSF